MDNSFCQRLAELTEKNGGGLHFSEKIGVSYAVLRKWIRGQSEPTVEILKRITSEGKVSSDWLLFGDISEAETNAMRRALIAFEEAWQNIVPLSPEAKAELILALSRMFMAEREEAVQKTTNIIKLFSQR